MIQYLLKVGDRVLVYIKTHDRQSGYDPCPDGTVAEIVGFSEIFLGRNNKFGYPPGVYLNRSYARIRLPGHQVITESASSLRFYMESVYKARLAEFRTLQEKHQEYWKFPFLRPLPETPFIEDQLVSWGGRPFRVEMIDYALLGDTTKLGGKYPAYQLIDAKGFRTVASEDDITTPTKRLR